MSVFVCDYDYNAPDSEHLLASHKRLYKIVRNKNPYLPIILVSRPNFDVYSDTDIKLRDVVYSTYIDAVADGDKQIYYIDGQSFFAGDDSCTVDGVHPNDLGFMYMAKTIGNVIRKVND